LLEASLVEALFTQLRELQEASAEEERSPLQTLQTACTIFSQQIAACGSAEPPAAAAAAPGEGAAEGGVVPTVVRCASRYIKGWLSRHGGDEATVFEPEIEAPLAACGFDWQREAFETPPDAAAVSDAFADLARTLLSRVPAPPAEGAAPQPAGTGRFGGRGAAGRGRRRPPAPPAPAARPAAAADAETALPPLSIARDIGVAFDMESFSAQYALACCAAGGGGDAAGAGASLGPGGRLDSGPAGGASPSAAASPSVPSSSVPSAGSLEAATRAAGRAAAESEVEGELRRVLPKADFRTMEAASQPRVAESRRESQKSVRGLLLHFQALPTACQPPPPQNPPTRRHHRHHHPQPDPHPPPFAGARPVQLGLPDHAPRRRPLHRRPA